MNKQKKHTRMPLNRKALTMILYKNVYTCLYMYISLCAYVYEYINICMHTRKRTPMPLSTGADQGALHQ